MLTLATVLPFVNLLSREIPKIFPSVFQDIYGKMSALSYDPVFLCHWVTSFALLTRGVRTMCPAPEVDEGIAVERATDATNGASVIVLTSPALSIIVAASAVIAAKLTTRVFLIQSGESLHESSRRATTTGHSVCAQNLSTRIGWNTVCAWFLPTWR